jgi:hypothetical protein
MMASPQEMNRKNIQESKKGSNPLSGEESREKITMLLIRLTKSLDAFTNKITELNKASQDLGQERGNQSKLGS